jgi:radical SAM family uncharacterized protein/radical SAM-linked protein
VRHKDSVRLRFVLAYPDAYEVGMSYLGLHILYDILNNREDIWCERVFTPWPDREEQMRRRGELLRTLESDSPVAEVDLIGLSLQHELVYTNALTLLDLAGLPLRAVERDESHPLVIAGGPCAYNPAPMSAFVDAFVIGEAEESVLELADMVIESKTRGWSRPETLRRLASLPGVFVPSLYTRVRNRLGEVCFGCPLSDDVPARVRKRIVDIEQSPYPIAQVVPSAKIIQRRLSLEIMRGCARGCRFCQAGFISRPNRERSVSRLLADASRALEATGYDEVSLLSLSSGDHSRIDELVRVLVSHCEPRSVSVSLPSLRLDGFDAAIPRELERVHGGGLTFAPEAGTDRLRRAINKPIDDATILHTIENAVNRHWSSCKLYFMVGLPSETDEDVCAIPGLSLRIRRALNARGWLRGTLHVCAGSFCPKPHTPYQWYGQIPGGEIDRRLRLIRSRIRHRGIKLSTGDIEPSILEATLARGDLRLSDVIEAAFRGGCRFDEWTECFRWEGWVKAFGESDLEPSRLAERTYEPDDLLPWAVIDTGLNPRYLWHEYLRTFDARPSHHCGDERCRVCGVCDGETVVTVHARQGEAELKIDHRLHSHETFQYRLRYEKRGSSAWLSHQDLIETIDSTLRRATIRLAFTKGYHPHPKIVFAGALPVGVESTAEYLDITATESYRTEDLCARLNAHSPEGIIWTGARQLSVGDAKITNVIIADEYRISWQHGKYAAFGPPLEVLERLAIASVVQEKEGVRIVVRRRRGEPPRLHNLMKALQDLGVIPSGATLSRSEQLRSADSDLVPVMPV